MATECSAHIGHGFCRTTCSRLGKIERNGKLYCTQHDPVRIAQQRTARHAESDAKWEKAQESKAEAERRQAEIERKAGESDRWRKRAVELAEIVFPYVEDLLSRQSIAGLTQLNIRDQARAILDADKDNPESGQENKDG